MSSVKLKESITSLPSYSELESDMRELVDRVLQRFSEGQVTIKKASKQIQGLFGEYDRDGKVHQIFNALARNMPLEEYIKATQRSKPLKNGAWTPEEDQLLIDSVNLYGTSDWMKIAESVGNGRTKAQCSQRWSRTLDPTISRELWTEKETLNLIKGVEKYGTKSWVKVAKMVGSRSDVQCRYHYKSYISSHQKKDIIKQIKTKQQQQPIIITPNPNSNASPHNTVNKSPGLKETLPSNEEINSFFLEDDAFELSKDFNQKDPLGFLDKMEFNEDINSSLHF